MTQTYRVWILLFAFALGSAGAARAQDRPMAGDQPSMAGHEAMAARHEAMMAEMEAADAKLDSLAAAMNEAEGGVKLDAVAALLNELVAQRKAMCGSMMAKMHTMHEGHEP